MHILTAELMKAGITDVTADGTDNLLGWCLRFAAEHGIRVVKTKANGKHGFEGNGSAPFELFYDGAVKTIFVIETSTKMTNDILHDICHYIVAEKLDVTDEGNRVNQVNFGLEKQSGLMEEAKTCDLHVALTLLYLGEEAAIEVAANLNSFDWNDSFRPIIKSAIETYPVLADVDWEKLAGLDKKH